MTAYMLRGVCAGYIVYFGDRGGILYICLIIDHVLPFCYKNCIEKGQLGKKGLAKGGIYSIHLFVHRLGSPFLLQEMY